jgi:hypothetical protein
MRTNYQGTTSDGKSISMTVWNMADRVLTVGICSTDLKLLSVLRAKGLPVHEGRGELVLLVATVGAAHRFIDLLRDVRFLEIRTVKENMRHHLIEANIVGAVHGAHWPLYASIRTRTCRLDIARAYDDITKIVARICSLEDVTKALASEVDNMDASAEICVILRKKL